MTLGFNPTTTSILTPASLFMKKWCLFHLIVIEPTFWSSMYHEISTLPKKYMTQNIFSLGKKLHQSLHNYHYQLYFCYNQRNIETKSNSIYVFLQILFYGSSSFLQGQIQAGCSNYNMFLIFSRLVFKICTTNLLSFWFWNNMNWQNVYKLIQFVWSILWVLRKSFAMNW